MLPTVSSTEWMVIFHHPWASAAVGCIDHGGEAQEAMSCAMPLLVAESGPGDGTKTAAR